ncbi:TonB-dependent receptor [Parapedobacter koreensis]|uniref:Iron complex outermembrane recepter protein n=1 Tax=Parapedobacter koreensis TaxID=332977 RepID=A0A1H7T8B9_9SPHI|nr:TonB-dependent receptor [Parapedobacter koreensis]SEL81130.1 iron complex outermembrane recepter protein [Parapedobacter koreensis]
MKLHYILLISLIIISVAPLTHAQQNQHVLTGKVSDGKGQPLPAVSIIIENTSYGASTDETGTYRIINIPAGTYQVKASAIGYGIQTRSITLGAAVLEPLHFTLVDADNQTLDEVIVTGVSRASLAKENPVPIVGVSAAKIEQSVESNIVDVLVKNVPGLTAVKTGPNISKPFIRGLGYNRVLTLFDGIRQEGQQWGDEHGLEVDAYNLERAEVVKGPASLIYGSDAVAGVVGLLPTMPKETDGRLHGSFTSEYQGNNGLIGNGGRLSYANERWAFTLRGSYRLAKNYTNSVDGRVYNSGFKEANASASTRYTSVAGFTSLNATYYNNLQSIPDGSRDSLSRRFTEQIAEGEDDDLLNRPIVPSSMLNAYTLSPLHQHIQHYRLYAKSNYTIGDGAMDALLAYQQNRRREYSHPLATDQPSLDVRLNTVNYGANYHLPTFLNTEVTVGVNGMYQQNESVDATDFPIPNYALFDAGIFGLAKWKYEEWTVSGGIRYDRRWLTGDDFYTRTNPATGFSERALPPDIEGAYLQFPAIDETFHGVSLSLGGTYEISPSLSLKANIARGYRAPNINEYAANGLDPGAHIIYRGNRDFEPEFSLQEDIGIDYSNPYVSATLSVFNNNLTNFIYLTQLTDEAGDAITDAQGNRTFQYQQSKAQLYGIEATLSLSPPFLPGFSFDNALAITYGFNRDEIFKGDGIQGEYLPLIPPIHATSSMHQGFTFNSSWLPTANIGLEADINAAQNRFLALNNTETYTPGYVIFNISAGADIRYSASHSLKISLQANNLFDRAYQSHLSRLKYFEYFSASPTGRLGIYNMGRNISVKLTLPF